MSATASQITGIHSTVCSAAYQIRHQSSASLACMRGIHRWAVNSPHKGPVTRKMFPFDDVIMTTDIFNHGGCTGCPMPKSGAKLSAATMPILIKVSRDLTWTISCKLQSHIHDQSGTKPKLAAKILATNFGFVPDWWLQLLNILC